MSTETESRPLSKKFLLTSALTVLILTLSMMGCSTHSTLRDPRLTEDIVKPYTDTDGDGGITPRECATTLIDSYQAIDEANSRFKILREE